MLTTIPFAAISELRYETLPAANAALAAVTATGTVQVADVQRREVSQEPPLLYDLTALQKEGSRLRCAPPPKVIGNIAVRMDIH